MPAQTASRSRRGAKRRASKREVTLSLSDAMLVALGHQLEILSAELAFLQTDNRVSFSSAALKEQFGKQAPLPSDRRIEEILSLLDPIERAIMRTPAQSVVGLGVKARHAAHVLSHYWTDSTDVLDWDMRAVRLLIESTCSVAGVGIATLRQ